MEFTWIDTYRELSNWILNYENRQSELVAILQDIGVNVKSDKDKTNNGTENIALNAIDPFSFFSMINSYATKRLEFIQNIHRKLKLKSQLPSDVKGIPVSNPTKAWLFPYKHERNNDDIKKLWTFFKEVLSDSITEQGFKDALNVKSSGVGMLTAGMFCVNPNKYIPINKGTKEAIEDAGANYNFGKKSNLSDVIATMNKTIDYFNLKPYEISESPYLYSRKTIYLDGHNIFKISHSPSSFSYEEYKYLLHNKLVVMHESTKGIGKSSTTQAQDFKNAKIGDFVYICRGNDEVSCIGRLTTGVRDYNNTNNSSSSNKGWIERSYEEIAIAKNPENYKNPRRRWSPGNNSTFVVIPHHQLQEANDNIFIPALNVKLTNNEDPIISKMKETSNLSDNLILYGPPGTGKTYALQHKYLELFVDRNETKTKDQYISEVVSSMTWWELIALTLYSMNDHKCDVSSLLNHKYIKEKFAQSNIKDKRARLWSVLQMHTKLDCTNVKYSRRSEPSIFEKGGNSIWSVDANIIERELPEILESLRAIESYKGITTVAKRYEFIAFHQKYAYEDFIVGITPWLDEDNNGELMFERKYGVFYQACMEALKLAGYYSFEECEEDSKEERKRKFKDAKCYAMLIDEINRANISAVFGELISCIEDDKRLGKENELFVTLPNGGGRFGVPANLKVIGTMNTADRSIAMIDIALRRRFEFEGCYPDNNLIERIDIKEILMALNDKIMEKKKSADYLIGHSYLMKAKGSSDVINAFNKKIIPLLYEYFQSNTSVIKDILVNINLGKMNIIVDESSHIIRVKSNE